MKNRTVRAVTLRSLLARFASLVLLAALFSVIPIDIASAQVAPSLGTAQSYAVLGGETVTNTGPSIITGDLGVSPGTAITGFPPGIVLAGTMHAADAIALQAQSDNTAAYLNLASQACDTGFIVPTDIGGLTLVPGVYCFSSSVQLTGMLTLDAGGDPGAVWVFQAGSTLVTASNASVVLVNGAQPCNVFWQVGSSATIGTGTSFVGSILALASISVNTQATIAGRALAQTGSVTLDSNVITASACALPPVVVVPPTLGKAFSPSPIVAGGTSTLTITLSNGDDTDATLTAPFTDTLPAGLTIVGGGSTTCEGTVTTTASSVTLTGGSIPANGSCTVTVDVTAANAGNFINTLNPGALQTSNGGNVAPAIASLLVTAPVAVRPTLSKSFNPATISANGSSQLTITLSNASAVIATLTAPLTDTLPAGLLTDGNASTSCGGVVSVTASTVTLTGGAIPANGSCTVTVGVTAPTGGTYINSLAAGALQTSNGSNVAPAIATITVTTPANTAPTLTKSFTPSTIVAGGTSTLVITLNNPNNMPAVLTAPLTDSLPSGVTVVGNASTTCVGGVVTAVAGSSKVTLTGGSIPANGSCTVTVTVKASNKGSYCNTIAAGALKTNKGTNKWAANATLHVTAPAVTVKPTLSKSFSPSSVVAGTTSALVLTLSNANSTAATMTASLTDNFPSGLVVAGVVSNTCGGTLTAVTGSSKVTLTGGSIPAAGSCKVTVNVKASNKGSYCNTIAAGALQTNKGNNANAASATLNVTSSSTPTTAKPTLTKAFTPTTIKTGEYSVLVLTLGNTNNTAAALTAPLTDSFPSGLTVYGYPSNTCGGTLTATTGSAKITLSGGSIPASGSCKVTVKVTSKTKGSYTNTVPAGALQTNKGNNASAATAMLTVKSSSGY